MKWNGGPAYACGSYDPSTGEGREPMYFGMSLHDRVALAALQALIGAGTQSDQDPTEVRAAAYARWAHNYADAWMEERERRGG